MLPLNEVGSQNSWGYDPAFFYAIENDYGGPDALKELVNTCHQHGLAVILDVVFNHAGAIDNILWAIARESFFDGDTAWGAMINFDHPQCLHFFAQNLDQYLASPDRRHVRHWWRELNLLRRNPAIQGPSPLQVHFAADQLLTFSRGDAATFWVLLNFGGWTGHRPLWELNLPDGSYRELWNSTWPAFSVRGEEEDEHTNGGRDAHLNRSHWLHVPDYGVVLLERTN